MTDTFFFKTSAAANKGAEMLAKATGKDWRVKANKNNRNGDGNKFIATCAPIEMMTVRSLMSGKEITIAADTPLCCNPSSETYWCM